MVKKRPLPRQMNLNSRSFDLNVKAVGIFLNDGLRFNKAVGKMVFKFFLLFKTDICASPPDENRRKA